MEMNIRCLLILILYATTSTQSQSLEDYVCGYCGLRNQTTATEAMRRLLQRSSVPQNPVEMGDIVNSEVIQEMVAKEVKRILSNISNFNDLIVKEVDSQLERRCLLQECIEKKAAKPKMPKASKIVEVNKWTVFQRRIDGKVDFFRGWDEYVTGFGSKTRNLWLGLEKIHELTKNGDAEMRVDLLHMNGTYLHAAYKSFRIGPASENYTLTVSGYSGSATDSLADHNNQPFSTKDSDNDASKGNCAASHNKGGWWYRNCGYSNLNGIFKKQGWGGIAWFDNGANRWMNLRFTEMRLRMKK